jgi:hypothetical protein
MAVQGRASGVGTLVRRFLPVLVDLICNSCIDYGLVVPDAAPRPGDRALLTF